MRSAVSAEHFRIPAPVTHSFLGNLTACRASTDEQVRKLRDDFEQRRYAAPRPVPRCLADRAAFYLMWHGGFAPRALRNCTRKDLTVERKLMVRWKAARCAVI
jgi:hypothetical protein